MRHAAIKVLLAIMTSAGLVGCAASATKEVVGSKHVVAKTTATMVVESVAIYMPFKGVVHNGSPRQIVIRGEDNLVSQITVHEAAVSKWQISAPADLAFQQHSDLQIEIPFIDMVQIAYNADLTFADKPFEAVQQTQPDAGAK
jgi:hypothetical protein